MKTNLNGREIEYQDAIHHTTNTVVSFWDRVKILFGKPIIINNVIYTKEVCNVLGSVAHTFVPPLFKKKEKYNGGMMKS